MCIYSMMVSECASTRSIMFDGFFLALTIDWAIEPSRSSTLCTCFQTQKMTTSLSRLVLKKINR